MVRMGVANEILPNPPALILENGSRIHSDRSRRCSCSPASRSCAAPRWGSGLPGKSWAAEGQRTGHVSTFTERLWGLVSDAHKHGSTRQSGSFIHSFIIMKNFIDTEKTREQYNSPLCAQHLGEATVNSSPYLLHLFFFFLLKHFKSQTSWHFIPKHLYDHL